MNLGCLGDSKSRESRCLLLSLKPLNYSSAWQECRSQGGGRLAHLDSLETYYSVKARHEKFRRAFWLWTSNPACGALSGHWVGAKVDLPFFQSFFHASTDEWPLQVTSSEDWFWVQNERSRDGRSFKRNWPGFNRRFHNIKNAAGPAVYIGLRDMKFRYTHYSLPNFPALTHSHQRSSATLASVTSAAVTSANSFAPTHLTRTSGSDACLSSVNIQYRIRLSYDIFPNFPSPLLLPLSCDGQPTRDVNLSADKESQLQKDSQPPSNFRAGEVGQTFGTRAN